MRKRGVWRVKKSLSINSGLGIQDSFLERPLHLLDELLVPLRIDERVRLLAKAFHLPRQIVEVAVRGEEDVAGQRLERGELAAVVVDRVGIARVADELVRR